jgi:NAD(P)-dependent dehydrogenase (short-subunit alcohol dehydrogenase family)
MNRLKGRTAIITGSGAGIGKASAILFASEGANVAIVTKTASHGRDTAKIIERIGGKSEFFKCDVSKYSEIRRTVENVLKRFGRIEILFNNAGTEAPPRSTERS